MSPVSEEQMWQGQVCMCVAGWGGGGEERGGVLGSHLLGVVGWRACASWGHLPSPLGPVSPVNWGGSTAWAENVGDPVEKVNRTGAEGLLRVWTGPRLGVLKKDMWTRVEFPP